MAEARVVQLDGPVHYEDHGGTGPAVVLVHGLGGSAVNWRAVAPGLAGRARVLAVDLIGFGRTPPHGRSAGMPANRRLLDGFLRAVVGGPAILVGNSMGGLLALMQAAAEPRTVSGLVLVAPAQPHPRGAPIDVLVWSAFVLYALPGVAEWYLRRRSARLGADGLVREVLRMLCVDPARVPPEVRAAHVALAAERLRSMPWSNAAFLEAARSLMGALQRRRHFGQMVAGIAAPALVIHGARDRFVPLAASRRLVAERAHFTLDVFPDVGHVPMLEAPGPFLASLDRWLAGPGRASADAARGTAARP